MSTARKSLEHHACVAGHRDQATWHYHRASKLFEKNHAYAARLVQIASTMNLPDRVPSEVEGNDTITTGIVGPPQTHGSGP
jgi:hypothetical protein